MRNIYIALVALLLISVRTEAQTFINPSFEVNYYSLSTCTWIDSADYPTTMNNSGCYFPETDPDPNSAHNVPSIHILNNTCDEDTPHLGNFFIGVGAMVKSVSSTTVHFGVRVSVALNKPTIDFYGRKYTITFWYKKPKNTTGVNLYVGASADCNQLGVGIDTVVAPTDPGWQMRSITTALPVGTQYITLMGYDPGSQSYPASQRYTYIDDFTITDVLGVKDISNTTLSLSPNPMVSASSFDIDNRMKMPCKLALYDITGRLVYEQKELTNRHVTIERNNLQTGMYFLRVTDNDQVMASGKLMVQ